MSKPVLQAGDRMIWAEAMREVRPLQGRAAAIPQAGETREQGLEKADLSVARAAADDQTGGVDRATAERLKRGLRPIEARLDLHGLTQAEAHRALIEFVEGCYGRGRRCLLVITGRGLGPEGSGVLKTAVPRWLAESSLRRRVLAVAAAQPRHGGAGALYILLRRRR
jgi:DNA-nicking Smr family endonuclease